MTFFRGRGFTLAGRQQSLHGVGRFDLLFADNSARKWLIELKAVPLKITDTDQLLRYYEELQSLHPEDSYIPCFVAPNIPRPVRNYLDGKGLEYQEIHESELQRVARERGVVLQDVLMKPEEPTEPTRAPAKHLDIDKEERHFPLDKAYPFAAVHGLGREAEEIKAMQFTSNGRAWYKGPTVRRYFMFQLFKGKGLLVPFFQQAWPKGINRAQQEEAYLRRWKERWDQE